MTTTRPLPEAELLSFLQARYACQIAIVYGSVATGEATPTSDVDLVVFTARRMRFPEASIWKDFLLDVWVHPLEDAEHVADFVKLHDGRVLVDHDGAGAQLLESVRRFLAEPAESAPEEDLRHRRAWIWKMLERAHGDDAEAHHRRHWLLADLPELWCNLNQVHYLGPKQTFRFMRERAPEALTALEHALRPESNLGELESAVKLIAGEHLSTRSLARES